MRILAQKLGSLNEVVAYFFKQLDQTGKGRPFCPWAVAATTTLPKEAEKLNVQSVNHYMDSTPGSAVLSSKGIEWLSLRRSSPDNPVVT